MRAPWIVLTVGLGACASSGSSAPPAAAVRTASVATSSIAADEVYGPRELVRDADALLPLYTTPLARAFLAEARTLPSIAPRTVWRSADRARWYRAADLPQAPEHGAPGEGPPLVAETVTETDFYASRYGSPLAYVRALEVLGSVGGVGSLAGQAVLDIGAGGLASGRMMAALGASVVGFDVDVSLAAIYGEPGDQGDVTGATGARGSLRLMITQLPFEPRPPEAPFDVILAKNTLKRGYIHPDRPVDPRRLVDLGVDDVTYLAGLHDLLKPGGVLLIYNVSPPPAPLDRPYLPWADGRSPWTPGEWEAAGFEVLGFDVVDDGPLRAMGRALRWEDVETSYFAHYTLVRRRGP